MIHAHAAAEKSIKNAAGNNLLFQALKGGGYAVPSLFVLLIFSASQDPLLCSEFHCMLNAMLKQSEAVILSATKNLSNKIHRCASDLHRPTTRGAKFMEISDDFKESSLYILKGLCGRFQLFLVDEPAMMYNVTDIDMKGLKEYASG